jgi:hypothetical protein
MLRQTTRQSSVIGPSFSEGSAPLGKKTATGGPIGGAMAIFLKTHDYTARLVKLEKQTYLHQHCISCGRDFAKRIDAAEWSAVHVGIFRFDALDEDTSKRWLSEKCPGQHLASEYNDRRRSEPNRSVGVVPSFASRDRRNFDRVSRP